MQDDNPHSIDQYISKLADPVINKRLLLSVTITTSPDSDKFVDALHTAAHKLTNDTGRYPTELLINVRVFEHIIYRAEWYRNMMMYSRIAFENAGLRPDELFGFKLLFTREEVLPELRAYVVY